jgi:hypothetical protein
VRFSQVAPLKEPGQVCNSRVQPNAETVDLSVVEWVPLGTSFEPPTVPTAKTYRRYDSLCPGLPVRFVGKESGHVKAELGPVTIWHEFEFEDFGDGPPGRRCFGTLFELNDGEGDVSAVAQPGDSGAWVFDDGVYGAWIGMLIARQGRRAYGCFSEFIYDAILNSGVFPNSLVPMI